LLTVHTVCLSVETVITHVTAAGIRKTQAVNFAPLQQEAHSEQIQSRQVIGTVAFVVLATFKPTQRIVFYVVPLFQDA